MKVSAAMIGPSRRVSTGGGSTAQPIRFEGEDFVSVILWLETIDCPEKRLQCAKSDAHSTHTSSCLRPRIHFSNANRCRDSRRQICLPFIFIRKCAVDFFPLSFRFTSKIKWLLLLWFMCWQPREQHKIMRTHQPWFRQDDTG